MYDKGDTCVIYWTVVLFTIHAFVYGVLICWLVYISPHIVTHFLHIIPIIIVSATSFVITVYAQYGSV